MLLYHSLVFLWWLVSLNNEFMIVDSHQKHGSTLFVNPVGLLCLVRY